MKKNVYAVILVSLLVLVGCKSGADEARAAAELEAAQNAKFEQQAEPAEQAEAEDHGDKPEGHSGQEAAQAEDLADGETRHFGAPFTIDDEPLTLAAALERSKEGPGPYKVEARVEKVCQKKGCWFTLAADDVSIPIRVRMKDYGFFVAKNGDGAHVVLEGTLERKTIDQALAQHFAEDEAKASGEPVRKVEGDEETFEFMASGVAMTRS